MGQPSSSGVAHAVKDGFARAASAPAILAGTLPLTFVVAQLPVGGYCAPLAAIGQYIGLVFLTPFPQDSVHLPWEQRLAWLLLWSFLAGGILDRLARRRPIRGRGFFAACGAHLPALLRLSLVEWLVWLAAAHLYPERYPGYAPFLIGLAAGPVFLYARVRLVVEDRRSAIGALLAGGRFIRRNPGAVVIFALFTAALLIGIDRSYDRVMLGSAHECSWRTLLEKELFVTLLLFVLVASWASAIALFQARLAHASYTAGPPLEWPESPAAEAITNLSSSPRP